MTTLVLPPATTFALQSEQQQSHQHPKQTSLSQQQLPLSESPQSSPANHPRSLSVGSLNPLYSIGGNVLTQETTFIEVSQNTTRVEISSSPPDSVLSRISKGLSVAVGHDEPNFTSGPPPPSPPASLEQRFDEEPPSPPPKSILQRTEPPVTFGDLPKPERPAPQRAGSAPRLARFSVPNSTAGPSQLEGSLAVSQYQRAANQSADGYLQPPPQVQPHKPTRRNTTGSAPRPVVTDDEASDALAEDIELHAEQIRRERQSKRAKAQQEAEAALTRNATQPAAEGVLVGNLIGEGHVNYVLMYNMLTGIRIGVSRCQAKIKRPLTDEDFAARHKFSFDIVGNELTPSAKYDFKFKDYAPWVFRELREDYFQLDPADYLLSLTSKYILSELGSPGKSGSFFYFSRDYRFIIKTIRHSEAKFLLRILKEYHAHVKENPHTLISRFYGLHRVKLPRGRKIHFVIMNNLFPPHRDIHETYDLKGSTVGRIYPEEKAEKNPRAVLKDLNWIQRGKMLELGPEKRALLTEQLRRDSEFLKRIDVMDYSLLVGIHNMTRGNRDNVRRNTLKVFSPAITPARRTSPEAASLRRAMRDNDANRLGRSALQLPEEDPGDRLHFIFYQDDGGLRATDEQNAPLAAVYYLGVIDILTPYTGMKKLEHFWKGMSADRHKISPVPPNEYSDRFFAFMKAIMRGGDGGASFV